MRWDDSQSITPMNRFIRSSCNRPKLNLDFFSSHSQTIRVTHLTDSSKIIQKIFFRKFLCQVVEGEEMTYQVEETRFALITSKHSSQASFYQRTPFKGIPQLFNDISEEIEIPTRRFPFRRPHRNSKLKVWVSSDDSLARSLSNGSLHEYRFFFFHWYLHLCLLAVC